MLKEHTLLPDSNWEICFANQAPGYHTGTITRVISEQPPYSVMGFGGVPTIVSRQESAANSMTTPAGSNASGAAQAEPAVLHAPRCCWVLHTNPKCQVLLKDLEGEGQMKLHKCVPRPSTRL